MADGTEISWSDATWNPVTGCTRVSPGCDNCYIERTPPLRMARRRFDKPGVGGTTGVLLHEDRLYQPLHWRKQRRVFVCSLADLFHEAVPTAHIAKVWATMARAPQHTFQVLTKRPTRARTVLNSAEFEERVQQIIGSSVHFPLLNVWLGTTGEDQKWADIRVPEILAAKAALHWASLEPLLGPTSLAGYLSTEWGLSWVIVGGESGPKARPMQAAWALQLRDECETASVPFHFKQWGEYVPPWHMPADTYRSWEAGTGDLGTDLPQRVGKRAAGRELDGVIHGAFPPNAPENECPMTAPAASTTGGDL